MLPVNIHLFQDDSMNEESSSNAGQLVRCSYSTYLKLLHDDEIKDNNLYFVSYNSNDSDINSMMICDNLYVGRNLIGTSGVIFIEATNGIAIINDTRVELTTPTALTNAIQGVPGQVLFVINHSVISNTGEDQYSTFLYIWKESSSDNDQGKWINANLIYTLNTNDKVDQQYNPASENAQSGKAVKEAISTVATLSFKVVDILPTEDIDTKSIYLVKTAAKEDNYYDEYIYVTDKKHVSRDTGMSKCSDITYVVQDMVVNVTGYDYFSEGPIGWGLNAESQGVSWTIIPYQNGYIFNTLDKIKEAFPIGEYVITNIISVDLNLDSANFTLEGDVDFSHWELIGTTQLQLDSKMDKFGTIVTSNATKLLTLDDNLITIIAPQSLTLKTVLGILTLESEGDSIEIMAGNGDITLGVGVGFKAYYNNYEIATLNDIPSLTNVTLDNFTVRPGLEDGSYLFEQDARIETMIVAHGGQQPSITSYVIPGGSVVNVTTVKNENVSIIVDGVPCNLCTKILSTSYAFKEDWSIEPLIGVYKYTYFTEVSDGHAWKTDSAEFISYINQEFTTAEIQTIWDSVTV